MSPRKRHADRKTSQPEATAASVLPSGLKAEKPRCGLCGKTKKLTKTECCGNWICDDEQNYRLFSFAHNSCYRNHDRYSLCAFHYHEGHSGGWKTCDKCRKSFPTEMYVYHGTNEYNFENLPNPPSFEPTRCMQCGRVISLSQDGYMLKGRGQYVCENCSGMKNLFS